MIKKILIVLALCGCTNKVITDSLVSDAKNNIDIVTSSKKECQDVGNLCKNELDSINSVCKQSIAKAKTDGWADGFGKGIAVMIMLYVAVMIFLRRNSK